MRQLALCRSCGHDFHVSLDRRARGLVPAECPRCESSDLALLADLTRAEIEEIEAVVNERRLKS